MQGIPDELPYTVAAEEFRTDPWLGSTADVLVTEEQVIEETCVVQFAFSICRESLSTWTRSTRRKISTL